MKWQRKLALVALVAILVSSAAPNRAWAGGICYKVEATGIGQDLGGGTSQALVVGSRLLRGTTVGSLEKTSFWGSVASVEGLLRFTTRYGTLTSSASGTIDAATGDFVWSGPVIDGTKKLVNATGWLALQGVQRLGDGSFTAKVTGEVCADLAPWLIYDLTMTDRAGILAMKPDAAGTVAIGLPAKPDNGMNITASQVQIK